MVGRCSGETELFRHASRPLLASSVLSRGPVRPRDEYLPGSTESQCGSGTPAAGTPSRECDGLSGLLPGTLPWEGARLADAPGSLHREGSLAGIDIPDTQGFA